jgi:hypothetical protein
MVEATYIPDTTDNPHWAYNQAFAGDNLQRVHNLEQAMHSCALVASNPEADSLGIVDMVDTQVEKEAHQRDARPGSLTRVRDRTFGDLHVYLAQHRWQDADASQWDYQHPPVF